MGTGHTAQGHGLKFHRNTSIKHSININVNINTNINIDINIWLYFAHLCWYIVRQHNKGNP